MKRNPQLNLLKRQKNAYGGELRNTRKGREGPRPLATKYTMHFVLRSSNATKDWSFKKPKNEQKIKQIVERFADKYGVKVFSLGNAGNHLHFHIKLSNRYTYRAFVRSHWGHCDGGNWKQPRESTQTNSAFERKTKWWALELNSFKRILGLPPIYASGSKFKGLFELKRLYRDQSA
jgi:hypothetical protein